jgi:hypothetical protein
MSSENPAPSPGPASSSRLLRVAWLAVLLGIGLEIVLLVLAAGFGNLKGVRPVVADLVQKVSWSVFVCIGVAFGTAVSKGRAAIGGFVGLVSGPAAFQGAKSLHKAVTQALDLPAAVTSPGPLVLGILKAVEYGCLGAFLAWLSTRPKRALSDYVFGGVATGVLFGGIFTFILIEAAPTIATGALVGRIVNELLHPIGCALVIFAAENLGKKTSASSGH